MLWLLAVSATLAQRPAVIARAQATVRIERAARASADDWGRRAQSQEREVIVRDEAGNRIRLRLAEYQ